MSGKNKAPAIRSTPLAGIIVKAQQTLRWWYQFAGTKTAPGISTKGIAISKTKRKSSSTTGLHISGQLCHTSFDSSDSRFDCYHNLAWFIDKRFRLTFFSTSVTLAIICLSVTDPRMVFTWLSQHILALSRCPFSSVLPYLRPAIPGWRW